ncbi:hypothetical protein BST81_26005 [Leptolyngbya sp. 'hensonii']|uniref:alpha/beta hydrolase n=1 Tax=Leptolyngbya sp. 'hensonii' TaxID=1922337 RepID=UPI00094F5843|nr:alpha/beta hydrolase [Leptolyngbya sp. 'hensonii']OLP15478.1 hypothetical protein BST81_26005 [Leptolyngbya sp. 'hensonii']
MMRHIEGQVRSPDGLSLYYQSWLPQTPAKATIGMIHGLGSHSGQFENMVQILVPCGYGVYGLDLRGHGKSPGQRGYINSWAEFRGDVDSLWQVMGHQHPTLPRFMLGHSLGAVVVLDYALRSPSSLPGIITMAPALKPAGVPPLRLAIGQMLSQVWPRFSLNTGIPENAGSHRTRGTAYLQDPLRHRKGTARLATEFLQASHWVQTHLHHWQSPILTVHGSKDIVALPEGSRILFEQIPIRDKEQREYEGAFHDLHQDSNTCQIVRDMVHWLDRHTARDPIQSSCRVHCPAGQAE